jgi:hypothetical protein
MARLEYTRDTNHSTQCHLSDPQTMTPTASSWPGLSRVSDIKRPTNITTRSPERPEAFTAIHQRRQGRIISECDDRVVENLEHERRELAHMLGRSSSGIACLKLQFFCASGATR